MAILTKAQTLDKRGMLWRHDSVYPLKQLKDQPRVQVRSAKNHLPAKSDDH